MCCMISQQPNPHLCMELGQSHALSGGIFEPLTIDRAVTNFKLGLMAIYPVTMADQKGRTFLLRVRLL